MTPKTMVETRCTAELEKRLAEGLEDIREGRTHGPFSSAKDAIRFLHSEVKKRKKARAHAS